MGDLINVEVTVTLDFAVSSSCSCGGVWVTGGPGRGRKLFPGDLCGLGKDGLRDYLGYGTWE